MTMTQEVTSSTSVETFSLRDLSEWEYKGDRSMRTILGLGLLVEIGVACFSFIELTLRGATVDRWLILAGMFGSFLILTSVGYFRLGQPPVETTVDAEAIRFVQPDGKVIVKKWMDASFRLTLREWNDYLIAGVMYPYKHDISPLFAPNIPLSPEAFQAILGGARAHGIAVKVVDIHGWWGTAHKEYHLGFGMPVSPTKKSSAIGFGL